MQYNSSFLKINFVFRKLSRLMKFSSSLDLKFDYHLILLMLLILHKWILLPWEQKHFFKYFSCSLAQISSPLKQRITELSRSGVESRLHWLDACTQVKFEQSRDPCGAIRHIGRLLSSPYDPEGPDTQGSNTSTSRDIRELSVPQISNVSYCLCLFFS